MDGVDKHHRMDGIQPTCCRLRPKCSNEPSWSWGTSRTTGPPWSVPVLVRALLRSFLTRSIRADSTEDLERVMNDADAMQSTLGDLSLLVIARFKGGSTPLSRTTRNPGPTRLVT